MLINFQQKTLTSKKEKIMSEEKFTFNLDELCEFLVRAKKATYAAGDATKKIFEKDGSTTLIYEESGRATTQ